MSRLSSIYVTGSVIKCSCRYQRIIEQTIYIIRKSLSYTDERYLNCWYFEVIWLWKYILTGFIDEALSVGKMSVDDEAAIIEIPVTKGVGAETNVVAEGVAAIGE